MVEDQEYAYITHIEEDAFSPMTERFNTEEWGFNVAACLTEYYGSSQTLDDPTYGQLVFYQK